MKKTGIDIVNGPLFKNLLVFAIPVMCSQLLQILFNAADTIIVGRFAGDAALAAVGATGSVVFLLISLFGGLSVGSNDVIARLIGRRDAERISKAVHTSFFMALSGGFVLTFAGIILAPYLLRLMQTPAEIIDKSVLYMRIYFLGIVFLLLYNFGAAVLRSKGDTRRPLYFLFFSGIVNVVLNLVMVIVLHMSVAGVAIATVVSEAISAFLVFYVLTREEDAVRLYPSRIRADKESALEIMRIGIPAGISGTVFALSNVVIQSHINSFNDTFIVAGNAAGTNIENFIYIGYEGFTQAVITFTGQCVGAERKDRIFPVMRTALLLAASAAVLFGQIVYHSGPLLLSLYTKEAAVIQTGMTRTFWVGRLLILNATLDVFVNSMRGMGHSMLPTAVMVAGICGIRFLWLGIMFPLYHSLDSVYMCFPVSWIITAAAEFILWLIIYRRVMKEL